MASLSQSSTSLVCQITEKQVVLITGYCAWGIGFALCVSPLSFSVISGVDFANVLPAHVDVKNMFSRDAKCMPKPPV